ncbi:MAG TPA: hypothetical protein VNA89_12965, partial [Gemmatimonadaceae bacterium]|nr:hypothetical protein [Gemmatimonadaceae bacterium]
DAFNGCWYSVFGTAGSGPGTNTVSLRTLSAALPTGVIANSSPSGLGGVRLVTGFGAGAWDNYIGNADAFRIGVGANDTLYNFDPTQTTPVAGALVISEFRTRGPGGTADEYVEIYNNTNSAHVVSPPDGSGGYAAAASDGAARCVIPFGTTIPARGHFLCAGTGYTLGAYAALDAAIATDIGDSQGLALYSTSNPANFTAGTRLDAAGFSGSAAGYSEGTPLSPAGGITDNSEHAFVRKQGTLTGGLPQDTNNNEGDFAFVATDGAAHSGRAAVLGAPGPQNTLSPISRNLTGTLIAPTLASTAAPNRERNLTAGPCATNGTLTLRRTITNNTGANVTRLRFRVVDVTTVNSPGSANTAQAIVRVLDSPDEPALSVPGRGTVQVHGLTIETPPAQPGCGGLNTSLTDDEVTVGTPIPSGGSVDVIFRLGIERGGSYRFYVNIEVLP